jgi:hypothetical protein
MRRQRENCTQLQEVSGVEFCPDKCFILTSTVELEKRWTDSDAIIHALKWIVPLSSSTSIDPRVSK